MRNAIRILFCASLLLFAASLTTCHFGVEYAVRQEFPQGVPPGEDIHLLGLGWVLRGQLLMLIAIAAGVTALLLRSVRQYRNRKLAGHSENAI